MIRPTLIDPLGLADADPWGCRDDEPDDGDDMDLGELPDEAYADRERPPPVPALPVPGDADRPTVGELAVEVWAGTTALPADLAQVRAYRDTPERRDPRHWRRILGSACAVEVRHGVWQADGTGLRRLWRLGYGEESPELAAQVDPHPPEVVVVIAGLSIVAYRSTQPDVQGRPVYVPSPTGEHKLRERMRQ